MSLKNYVNVSSKSKKQKNIFVVGIFEVTDENKPDLIRKSVVRIRES
jgi:hypothetical protein